jgi:hypothetical protein
VVVPQPYQPGQPVQAVPVVTQPGQAPQQVVLVPAAAAPQQIPPQPTPAGTEPQRLPQKELAPGEVEPLQLRVYSHSNLYYWWPVWAVGFLMAALTYFDGNQIDVHGHREWFSRSSDLGVIYFVVLFLVILITNVSVRGMASAMVILSVILATVLLAYFNLWDQILGWFGHLKIHMNLGAYFWFSLLLFIVWVLTVFAFDRTSYWVIKPGQIIHEKVFGAGSKSYDTEGMVLEKFQGDLFRNWLIGLGTGDLHIQTFGANRERIDIPNVLFVISKVATIQRMIAMKPDEFGRATIK